MSYKNKDDGSDDETPIGVYANRIMTSIISQWYKGDAATSSEDDEGTDHSFTDNEKMSEKGIVAEAVGVTSVFLLMIAFDEDSDFQGAENSVELRDQVKEIAEISTSYIYDQYVSKGFNAEPEISDDITNGFMTKDCGYIESLTMVVSAMILVRFADKKGIISITGDTKDKVFKLISVGLRQLLDSQHPDGTWGFLADQDCKSSLVYTYYASATLADVFDYILGEISEVEDSTASVADLELLVYLNKDICPESKDIHEGIKKKLVDCRNKISDWLIDVCMPVLPKFANCDRLEDSAYDEIYAWKQDDNDDSESYYADKNFINLYYAYYIIDMITVCNADNRFQDRASTVEGRKAIKEIYSKKLPMSEIRYFFGKNDNDLANIKDENLKNDMFIGYMEQSIHAARNNFMIASRTGSEFWDTTKAELKMKWEHNDKQISFDCKNAFKMQGGTSLTDPAILPMALRVNTCFSYYISCEREYSLKRLYEMIIDSMCVQDKNKCKMYTWDKTSYNLRITERCIEAIVDYHDYLLDYGDNGLFVAPVKSEKPVQKVKVEVKPSDIDVAIERKVNECIEKRMATLIIGKESTAPVSDEQITAAVDKYINQMLSVVKTSQDIYNDTDNKKNIAWKLLEVHNALDRQRMLMASKMKKGDAYDSKIACSRIIIANERINELLSMLLDDVSESEYDLVNLYKKIKAR